MDFEELLRQVEDALPTEPRELYEQLPAKKEGYGYAASVATKITASSSSSVAVSRN